jgi:hypothetical protein
MRNRIAHRCGTGHLLLFAIALVCQLAWPAVAWAQGEVSGRILTADSARLPVPAADITVPRLDRTVQSDSLGRFRLKELPPGMHLIVARAIGFKAETTSVRIEGDDVLAVDLRLERSAATTLPERIVTAPEALTAAKLVEFTEREKMGVGHFIKRDQLAKAENGLRQTGDLISLIPGVLAKRGSNRIWVATGRAVSASCAFCRTPTLNPADIAAGARPACFMDVYIDGALVFDSRQPANGLFDVNTVPPAHIAGIEVYTSASQVPAKYNRTGTGCGVLLIWTR